jgi:REP element-mobilizing transposase RayT/uncharacterized protein YdhG (YjbR/CyaY superfamily)
MPRLRKYHVNKSVLFITNSIEQGLMLNANKLCKLILNTCLARAQALHPVRICHFVVEATHIHMTVIVDNPNDIKDFMERFKTESATRLNKVLGRQKRTIWCKGYDSCIIQTIEKAKDVIAYIYSNPAKDNLEDSIDSYPGLSSWKMFQKNELEKIFKYVRRPAFKALTRDAYNIPGFEREANRLMNSSKDIHTFKIDPNAWMEAFNITLDIDKRAINDDIVKRVRKLEDEARVKRTKEGKSVMGAKRLNQALIDTNYLPERNGRKMWVVSDDAKLRKQLIAEIRALANTAREVYHKWKIGDYRDKFPLGMYPPCLPKIAEPAFVEI